MAATNVSRRATKTLAAPAMALTAKVRCYPGLPRTAASSSRSARRAPYARGELKDFTVSRDEPVNCLMCQENKLSANPIGRRPELLSSGPTAADSTPIFGAIRLNLAVRSETQSGQSSKGSLNDTSAVTDNCAFSAPATALGRLRHSALES